jgi:transcription antitermination factor NusG
VQTRHHHEKRVAERLHRTFEVLLPTYRSVNKWKNGVHAEVELPLFPSYLFVRFSASQRIRMLQDPSIVSLAASNTTPTPIPDDEIARLRTVAGSLRTQPHPYLAIGQRARIISGPFAGMEGVLVRRKQELRVVISIEIILRAVAVEVSELEIEPMGFYRGATAC